MMRQYRPAFSSNFLRFSFIPHHKSHNSFSESLQQDQCNPQHFTVMVVELTMRNDQRKILNFISIRRKIQLPEEQILKGLRPLKRKLERTLERKLERTLERTQRLSVRDNTRKKTTENVQRTLAEHTFVRRTSFLCKSGHERNSKEKEEVSDICGLT